MNCKVHLAAGIFVNDLTLAEVQTLKAKQVSFWRVLKQCQLLTCLPAGLGLAMAFHDSWVIDCSHKYSVAFAGQQHPCTLFRVQESEMP